MFRMISISVVALLLIGCESLRDDNEYCDGSSKPFWPTIFHAMVGAQVLKIICSRDESEGQGGEKLTPTDLSSVKEGALRADIEKALGWPLRSKEIRVRTH